MHTTHFSIIIMTTCSSSAPSATHWRNHPTNPNRCHSHSSGSDSGHDHIDSHWGGGCHSDCLLCKQGKDWILEPKE